MHHTLNLYPAIPRCFHNCIILHPPPYSRDIIPLICASIDICKLYIGTCALWILFNQFSSRKLSKLQVLINSTSSQ
ncbi:Os08g0153700 [Oryza sativa Japonica Group]|uniref:Os08g0153700 protein n=1 Tax=Oryza sativa subsp. japonica TaxID=39947 RepID=A0A0P0XBY4_ORYSJ|nr:hypothetical protein EE612_042149 [Oryza sativa]BAT03864.1 Os08g0153700 [Oryza sativa Japonica Group]